MVNREYIKSQIDTLPEETVIGIDKYIARQNKKNAEKAKRNAEYLAKIDESRRQIEEGNFVAFEWEEFEAMTKMPPEEAIKFCEKIKARGKK
jgi:hypothetical protein